MKAKILIAFFVFFSLYGELFSQTKPVANPILTADSLATGNYKDVLNSFFQLAFDRLTSPTKELKFTSSPFAVMAKLDTTLLVDTSYLRYKTLRNLNFAVAANFDSSYHFNGFSSGIKYALINKRDETVSRVFLNMVTTNESTRQLFALNNLIAGYISSVTPFDAQVSMMADYTAFRKGVKNFGDLPQSLQDSILAIANRGDSTQVLASTLEQNKGFNLATTADSIYNSLKTNFNNNLLWTVAVSDTTYKDEFFFSNIVLSTELLKGLNCFEKRRNDFELDIKADLQFLDDTMRTGRDLKRLLFNFEPGVNVTFKTKKTMRSFMEFKLGGSYCQNFSYLYANEERYRITVNAALRIRIFNDIWIPIEIKYDPKNGNVFGFLNVRANFRALRGAAKQLF